MKLLFIDLMKAMVAIGLVVIGISGICLAYTIRRIREWNVKKR